MNNSDFVTEKYITDNWGGGTGSTSFLTKTRAIDLGADPEPLTNYQSNQFITFGDLSKLSDGTEPPTPPLTLRHTYTGILYPGVWIYDGGSVPQKRRGYYTGQGGRLTRTSSTWGGVVEVHMFVDTGSTVGTGAQLQMTSWDNNYSYTAVIRYSVGGKLKHWISFKQRTPTNRWMYPGETTVDGTISNYFSTMAAFLEEHRDQRVDLDIKWYA